MLPQEIIRKKRCGEVLSESELRKFFSGFLHGDVAAYQVSAMLMAIVLKGMNRDETASLTRIMRDSGERFTWSFPRHVVVDKHSTGGIGDKTSLVLLPLCILAGLKVPMIAGRGLGHTGGTLDKLEAVGWRVFPSFAAARHQMETLGGIIMGQTETMVPLDRRLYAMRDVTDTVESIPLIVASILSKKLSEGIGGLVMDVKFGTGAFMVEFDRARHLAHELKAVGEECGINVRCLLSNMNSPLGTSAGNALEMHECIEVLRGDGPSDTRELSLALAAEMVHLGYPDRDLCSIRSELEEHVASGRAYELFLKIAAAQGGDVSLLETPGRLFQAKYQLPVQATGGSKVAAIDVRALGLAVIELGGGRRLMSDAIDPWVGLTKMKHVGEALAPGEPVAIVHANDEGAAAVAASIVQRAYELSDQAFPEPLIKERL